MSKKERKKEIRKERKKEIKKERKKERTTTMDERDEQETNESKEYKLILFLRIIILLLEDTLTVFQSGEQPRKANRKKQRMRQRSVAWGVTRKVDDTVLGEMEYTLSWYKLSLRIVLIKYHGWVI